MRSKIIMWVGLDWLIMDSIANCLYSGIKKKKKKRKKYMFVCGAADGLLAKAD